MRGEKKASNAYDWSARIALGCVVAISSFACCCQILPNINLKRKLAREEVVGVWVPTAETLALAKREGVSGNAPSKLFIELKPDGTCVCETISSDFGWNGLRYIRGSGKWSLEHDSTGDSNTKKANVIGITIEGPDGRFDFCFNATDDDREVTKDGEFLLWNFHGDPDSWDLIKYRREE